MPTNKSLKFLPVLLLLAPLSALASQAHFSTTFIPYYENVWSNPLIYCSNVVDGFSDSLDVIDVFDWERAGTDVTASLYTTNDSNYVDDVDIHFHCGHGTTDGTHVGICLYGLWEIAYAHNMILGDGNLEWLALYSCTVAGTSNPWANSWGDSFQAGLHAVMGGYENLYLNRSYSQVGEDFADNLRDGDLIKNAWLDAMDAGSNYPAIIYAGDDTYPASLRIYGEKYWNQGGVFPDPDPGDCWYRLRRIP